MGWQSPRRNQNYIETHLHVHQRWVMADEMVCGRNDAALVDAFQCFSKLIDALTGFDFNKYDLPAALHNQIDFPDRRFVSKRKKGKTL